MRVAISLTAHESPLAIVDQCLNIFYFLEDPIIVIHINKSEGLVYEKLKFILNNLDQSISSKIYLNPNRFDTGKNAFSLHLAHLGNYDLLAKAGLGFDYFALEASNSLFIRKGAERYMADFDVGIGRGVVAGYWKDPIINHNTLNEYLCSESSLPKLESKGRLCAIKKGCHEGAFFSSGVVDQIFSEVRNIDELCKLRSDPPHYPTEEVWFQVAVTKCQHEKKDLTIGDTLTYLPWHRNLLWSDELLEGALNGNELPRNKFSIKRISRVFDDPHRQAIAHKFGYRNLFAFR